MLGSALDYAVVALYFAVMVGAGYWGLRRARSADDYLVAGRRLGPAMYLGTLSAVVDNDVYAGYFRQAGNRVRLSRIFTLLVGAAVRVISLIVKDVVGALTVAYDLLSGALFVPIIGALFWRGATGAGTLAVVTLMRRVFAPLVAALVGVLGAVRLRLVCALVDL